MKNKIQTRHNCNMCKKSKMCFPLGNICFGEKCHGKVIKYDDAICDEYEFGGFIELFKGTSSIPKYEHFNYKQLTR